MTRQRTPPVGRSPRQGAGDRRARGLFSIGIAAVIACAGPPLRERVAQPDPQRHVGATPAARAATPDRTRATPADERALLAWASALAAETDPAARAAACARRLGMADKRWRDCDARRCGSTAVVLIEAADECGADSCAGDAYAVTATGARLALPFGGHKACSHDGAFVVADVQLTPAGEEAFHDPRQWKVVLHRFPLDGSSPSFFADCMSPVLAPGGREFLCRNSAAAVLKLDAASAATSLVAAAGVPASRVTYHPQSYLYPAPPRFDAAVLRFRVDTDAGPIERGVPWRPASEPGPPRRSKRTLPSCDATLCDDQGTCIAPSPPHCR